MIEIKKVSSKSEIKIIAQLANNILHEVYDPIIPSEHTNYFIDEFQSERAIKRQIEQERYHYYLLNYDNESVGYLGIQKNEANIILSKLYILNNFRGKKIGKTALRFVNNFANQHQVSIIQLLVNTQNLDAIAIYKKHGFTIVESITNSFPNGHMVEDYLMKKTMNL